MHRYGHHIVRVRKVWRGIRLLEAVIAGAAAGVALWFLVGMSFAIAGAIVVAALYLLLVRPWRITDQGTAEYLDARFSQSEFSAGLLLKDPSSLSGLARLQQRKVSQIMTDMRPVRYLPPNSLGEIAAAGLIVVVLGFTFSQETGVSSSESSATSVPLITVTGDTTRTAMPEITDHSVTIRFPSYTGKKEEQRENLSQEVLEGSRLTWRIRLSGPVDTVMLISETEDRRYGFKNETGNDYQVSVNPEANLIYHFRLVRDSVSADTETFYVALKPDMPPVISPVNMPSFIEFEADETAPAIRVEAGLSDDFGLTDAYVVATVSRGSGESVKFREEILRFQKPVSGRETRVGMNILLDSLGMLPGDELYYYLEAKDNRQPEARTARTETRFVVIADTVEQAYMTGGSMAVDLMPDYFRSQRQIIIDTEALVEAASTMPNDEFRQQSNALGYDQKLLRIKYGQYLGDEFESGITQPVDSPEEVADASDEDATAAYTHDHDHEDEGVEAPSEPGHDHEHDDDDPLEAFIHDHSDPEEATLYTQGVRAMLRQALTEMWDAELYLRLYQPEKSLPYQYRALDLIQKIRNQARIYVHRIGFDPPPIREDARLSGDLENIENTRRVTGNTGRDSLASIRESVRELQALASGTRVADRQMENTLRQAAAEVAQLATDNPGRYLKTLTALRTGIAGIPKQSLSKEEARLLAVRLSRILPAERALPGGVKDATWTSLDSIFQKNVEGGAYD